MYHGGCHIVSQVERFLNPMGTAPEAPGRGKTLSNANELPLWVISGH